MDELRMGARDLLSILSDAGRVLKSAWPALITIFLIGYSLRTALLYLAVEATRISSYLGQALLPLALLALLLALVLMLRVAWRSMPGNVVQAQPFGRQLAEDLRLGTSLMIPFVAVYASAGLLREDNLAFLRAIFLQEQLTNGTLSADLSRYDWLSGWALIVVVVIALAIRWALLITGLPRRSWGWAAVGAYVEALWVASLARAIEEPLRAAFAWLQATLVGQFTITNYQRLVSLLGPLEPVIRVGVSWTFENAASIAGLVFLPLAWLAIGQTAADAEHDPLEVQPPQGERWQRWQARTAQVAQRVRRYRNVAQPAWDPISDLLTAVRHIIIAGWVPMISFAVLFFLAGQLRVLVVVWSRVILGPQLYVDFVSTKPLVVTIELLVYSTVIVALITGGVRLVDVAFARASATPAVPGSEPYGSPPGSEPYGSPPYGSPGHVPQPYGYQPQGFPSAGSPPAPRHYGP